MKKLAKLIENTVKAMTPLKEYTDNDFSGAKVISDVKQAKPDSKDMEIIKKYFPNAVRSMSKAEANLRASDNSPIKKRMGQYAPMFVHVQYHTFTETSGQTFSVHQTQYYNSNFKDQDPNFNPRVTELYFMRKDEMSKIGGLDEKMGSILATTDEYIKDLKDLERLGMLGKRVSESLNEAPIDGDRQMITRAIENMTSGRLTVDQIGIEIGRAIDQASISSTMKQNLKFALQIKKESATLNENDKFYDADKEQKHDEEDMPGGYDDEGRPLNEGKGLDEASKLIKHLREKVYRNLNDQELEEFTKEMVDHLGGTMNEAIDPKYKTFYDQVYKHVNELDRILGANKPPKVPEEIWSKVYGLVGQMADKIDFLALKENKMNAKTESIVKRLKEDSEYQKFFKSAMDKFGVKSPKGLSDKKKKEFFNYVDKNYKAKSE